MMKINITGLDMLDEVAEKLIKAFPAHRIFALSGELGAGKTTLIKAISKCLDVSDVVSSPTFAIVNEYYSETNGPLYHFDFYRLKNREELLDIGIYEYLDSGNYCFIEWPEKFQELLPDNYVYIKIDVASEGKSRRISAETGPFGIKD